MPYTDYLKDRKKPGAILGALRQQMAQQPSGNGRSGQVSWLSFAGLGGGLSIGGRAQKSSCGAGATAALTASSNRSNSTSVIALSGVREHDLKSLLPLD
jgi:hypothetical protein